MFSRTQKLANIVGLRLEDNARAVEILSNNGTLWKQLDGPDPELLLRPTEDLLLAAQRTATKADALLEARGSDEDLECFTSELRAAVAQLRVASWEALRLERFNITPAGLFDELARNAEVLLGRRAGELERRRVRLVRAAHVEEDLGEVAAETALQARVDKYGLDLDEFVAPSSRKPRGWARALAQASEVVLDEMRALLELHYDDVFNAEWRARDGAKGEKRPPSRNSEFAIFRSCQAMFRRSLNERLRLPSSVKELLRGPLDETCWERLEHLRGVVVALVLGQGEIEVSEQDAEGLAACLLASPGTLLGEVGLGVRQLLPVGACVMLDLPNCDAAAELRALAADTVRGLRRVRFQLRPLGGRHRALLSKESISLASSGATVRERAEQLGRSVEEAFDEILVVLWDALFLKKCEEWRSRGLGNTVAWESLELARWFLRGQRIGAQPLFDGLCSQCGALLHGDVGSASLSNKEAGPPLTRDGLPALRPDGTPRVEAQPPFLLRYSPEIFARELPAVFIHEPETNRLRLRDGVREPWLRQRRGDQQESADAWLYCPGLRVVCDANQKQSGVVLRWAKANWGSPTLVRTCSVCVLSVEGSVLLVAAHARTHKQYLHRPRMQEPVVASCRSTSA